MREGGAIMTETINTVIQIINGVGFPIAACIAMAAFIVWDKVNRRKAKQQEAEKYQKMFGKLEEAVNSNTAIVQQLLERMNAK